MLVLGLGKTWQSFTSVLLGIPELPFWKYSYVAGEITWRYLLERPYGEEEEEAWKPMQGDSESQLSHVSAVPNFQLSQQGISHRRQPSWMFSSVKSEEGHSLS